ncbi:MAG: hypothetical protein Q9208_003340 [Pyrenodesmia sp. 3 TL-2023]
MSTYPDKYRATESELDHLFQRASIGHERTFNQRIRPGLIIIINKDAPDSDERWLDVDYATNGLLRHLELSTKFADLKEQWRLRGSRISTARELILCYYDSFRIICIPSLTPETTHEITVQYSRLYLEILDTSRRLRRKRIQAHMNLNVRSFCNYVEHVYNRLARDLQSSVDFHYLASRNASRPIKFRDHVVALIVKLKEEEENVDPPCDVQETKLINRVIPFLASCIASHSVSDNTQRDAKIQLFLRDCRQALERFRETSWRCEARNGQERCLNYWVGHEKGHQFSRQQKSTLPQDPSLLVGTFHCKWDPEGLMKALYAEICQQGDLELETTFPDTAKRSGSIFYLASIFNIQSVPAVRVNLITVTLEARLHCVCTVVHWDVALRARDLGIIGSNLPPLARESSLSMAGTYELLYQAADALTCSPITPNHTGQDTDYLVREDDLDDELKCWEAARCTAAAPTYFPPFYHKAKRQSYIDGALHRNNPIQVLEEERRAIWRDNAPPDILLSIGTGIQVGADGCAKSAGKRHKTAMRLLPEGIRGKIAVGLDVIQSTVDCNRQWDEFVKSMKWDRDAHRVCHRLNIGLQERPPILDDVDAILHLKQKARWYLRLKDPSQARRTIFE